jgi:two-component sensor histidine kinase
VVKPQRDFLYEFYKRSQELLPRGSVTSFLLAAALVMVSTLIRMGFGLLASGETLLFASYYPSILLVTLLCGVAAGVFAISLSLLIVWWLFMSPEGSFGPLSHTQLISMTFFVSMAALTVWLADGYRKLVTVVETHRADHELLLREAQHRGKNIWAIIQSIIYQTLKHHPEDQKRLSSRIAALAAADGVLATSPGQRANLKDLIEQELRPYGSSRYSIKGKDVNLNPGEARAVSLLCHELATNGAKHGALSTSGHVSVFLGEHGGKIELTWEESGGPAVHPLAVDGFGMSLVKTLCRQLGGSVRTEFLTTGVVHEIQIGQSRTQR